MDTAGDDERSGRVSLACRNCRLRKKKCDRQVPCGPCVKRGVECAFPQGSPSGSDFIHQRGVVEDLQAEVALLEAKVSEIRAHNASLPHNRTAIYIETSPDLQVAGFDDFPPPNFRRGTPENVDLTVFRELETVTLYHGETYSLKRMIRRALQLGNCDPRGLMSFSSKRNLIGLMDTTSSRTQVDVKELISCSMTAYVDQYFDCVHPTFPFLIESNIRRTLMSLSSTEHQPPASLAALYLVSAIGAVFPSSPSFFDICNSTRFFLRATEVEFAYEETIETAQILLLFTIYSLFDASAGNSWQLVDLAMQTCIVLGLHQPYDIYQNYDSTNQELDQREGTFWTAYLLDYCIGSSLGLPKSIQNFDIGIKVPLVKASSGPDLGILCSWAFKMPPKASDNLSLATESPNQLSIFDSRLVTSDFNNPDPSLILHSIIGFQLLGLALHSNPDFADSVFSDRDKKTLVENHIRFIESLALTSYTLPWIAGYSIFQTAMMHLFAYGNISRTQVATEAPILAKSLLRVHTALTILSSKFKGLSEYANLINSIQLIFTSSTSEIKPNIDFLSRTNHYAFCKSVLESVGITPGSASANNHVPSSIAV